MSLIDGDHKQFAKVQNLFLVLAALSGLLTIVVYFEKKEQRKVEKDVLQLDKSIKELQLQRLQKPL